MRMKGTPVGEACIEATGRAAMSSCRLSARLAAPDILAAEIAANLQGALEQSARFAEELRPRQWGVAFFGERGKHDDRETGKSSSARSVEARSRRPHAVAF